MTRQLAVPDEFPVDRYIMVQQEVLDFYKYDDAIGENKTSECAELAQISSSMVDTQWTLVIQP